VDKVQKHNSFNTECKRPFGRPRHRGEDNIRMYLTEIWWKDVDWMHLAIIWTSGGIL
jgi:hypothetical protein